MGHDVLFVEPVDTGGSPLEYTPAASYFRRLVTEFGLEGSAALIDPTIGDAMGLGPDLRLRTTGHRPGRRLSYLLGCHPGLDDDSGSPYSHERNVETATLCDPQVLAAVHEQAIQLDIFLSGYELRRSFHD